MSADLASDQAVILQVVRGERPWTDLRQLGIRVEIEGTPCTYHNPRPIEATADVHDLARGFLAYWHDPRRLREWAFVLEASDIDLDTAGHPAGEQLLDALWRASFGESLGEAVFRTVAELAGWSQSQSRARG
jgi:hypothetical protein